MRVAVTHNPNWEPAKQPVIKFWKDIAQGECIKCGSSFYMKIESVETANEILNCVNLETGSVAFIENHISYTIVEPTAIVQDKL